MSGQLSFFPRAATLCAVLAVLAGCAEDGSPEQQVRATIAAMEHAVESRDVGELMGHVSENYRDGAGRGPTEAARYARGYFIAHQSLHLLTRIEQMEFPTRDEARARILVGMSGRDARAVGVLDLSAELYELDVTLVRESDAWKVSYAQWRSK